MEELPEEQQAELGFVMAMYDTVELLPPSPDGCTRYSVAVAPTAGEKPQISLEIEYPMDYPETALKCSVIWLMKGEHVNVETLQNQLNVTAGNNVGGYCATELLQDCQDFLQDLKRGPVSKAEAAKAILDETEDFSIRQGTTFSVDAFNEWKAKHMAEKAAAKENPDKKSAATVKLTGRQLWDSALKNADWDLFGGGDDEDVNFENCSGDEDEFEPQDEENDT